MLAEEVSLIVGAVAADIGSDAAYVRRNKKRLYLTGIEIAALVATGVLTSFLIGVFTGVKKRVGEVGEGVGEAAVDAALERLFGIQTRAKQETDDTKEDLVSVVTELKAELSEVTRQPVYQEIHIHFHLHSSEASDQVALYLADIGYPSDVAAARSRQLVERIERELGDL